MSAPLHPLIRASVPRTRTAVSVALAWMQAAALVVVFAAAGAAVDALAAGTDPTGAIVILIAGVLVAAVAAGMAVVLSAHGQSEAEEVLRQGVVDALFDGGVRKAPQASRMLALATSSVERAARYRAAFLGPTLGAFTTPFLVLALIAILLDPVIAGVLTLLVVLVPVLLGVAQRASSGAGAENRSARAALAARFLQNIQGLGTLVAADAAERAETELAAQGQSHRRTLMRVLAANQILILVMDIAISLGVVLITALLAVARVSEGVLSPGAALSVILCTLLVIRPVDLVGQFFYIGIGGRTAQLAIGVHLGRAQAQQREWTPTPATETDTSASVVLRDITAGWTPERPVVSGLSFTIEEGEKVALVGPSGIGKSTVSALIQAHIVPSSGSVVVAGLDAAHAPAGAIRDRLAIVEQRTHLFHGTIADNLRLADPQLDEAGMWGALESAGLADEVRRMPARLDTLVGEHGLSLSGGQSQRLAVARAFIRDAPILVLDEPTSQVDLAGERAFLDRLTALTEGRTVLMIAHRPAAVLAADRVINLTSEKVL